MSHVVIVGHRGRMGAMLMERFSRREDLTVVGIDRPFLEKDMAETCRGARAVILCIPASAIAETVEMLKPHMAANCILADITSVKELPMRDMERVWNGPVVGTHPLFGPTPPEGMELRVPVVPGKQASQEDVAFIEGLFQSFGCVTFQATAEEHDLAEAKIQGMNFITSAVYFAMTAEDPALLRYLTPSFLRRKDSAEKQLTENRALFTWLFEANPHSQAMVLQYLGLLSMAATGNVDLILDKAEKWWIQDNTANATQSPTANADLQATLLGREKG